MSTAALISVLIPAGVSAAAYLLIFEGLRGSYTRFFAPRFPGCSEGKYPHTGWFGWIWGVLFVDEETLVTKSGMDAAVYVRYMQMSLTVFSILSVLGMALLVPVYATGGGGASQLERVGLGNVIQGSDRLWAPTVMIWVFSVIILYIITKTYNEIVNLRKVAMQKGDSSHYTVLITGIPDELDTDEKIRAQLEPKFPGSIAYVKPVKNLTDAAKKVEKLQQAKLALVKAINKKGANPPEDPPPTVKLGCLGLCGKEVEAIPHLNGKISELQEEIEQELKEAKFCNAAFVTFSSVQMAAKAGGVRGTDNSSWKFRPATRPKDVLWGNLCNQPSSESRSARSIMSTAVIITLIILWAVFMAFGGALSNISELGKQNSFLGGIEDLPASIVGIIEGFGPTVWRVLLMILLQPILYGLLRMVGLVYGSVLEDQFMGTYYMFLLVNIYFVTLLSSSIFGTINEIISSPTSLFQLLGESIPAVAGDMIGYMLLQGLGLGVQKIVRLVGLILTMIFTKFASTEYEKEKAQTPPDFPYGADLALALLMWTIGCAYATIAPLILPFATVYFFFDLVVKKYNLLYVHVPNFETYGTFWPRLASISVNALVLSQVALMAILGLRFGSFQQILLFPLPLITYFYGSHLRSTLGNQMTEFKVPLFNAYELDEGRSKAAVRRFLKKAHELEMWAQPCMLVDFKEPLKPLPEPPLLEDVKEAEDKADGDLKAMDDAKDVKVVDVEINNNQNDPEMGSQNLDRTDTVRRGSNL